MTDGLFSSVTVRRFLLEMGAEPEAPDEAGITPAQLTKRDDIAAALEAAIAGQAQGRRQPPAQALG